MARRAAFYLSKGGVGKTTLSVHLAAGLALAGRRVLLADVDSRQAQAVMYLAGLQRLPAMHDLVVGGRPLQNLIQSPTGYPNLHVLTGTPNSTTAIEHHLADSRRSMSWFKSIQRIFEPVEDQYDYILFDCGPVFNHLIKSVLYYCTELWLPWKIDYMSVDSTMNILQGELEELERDYSFVRYVIPNALTLGGRRRSGLIEEESPEEKRIALFNRTKLNADVEVIEYLKAQFRGRLTPPVRTAESLFKTCQAKGALSWELEPQGELTDDLAQIVELIVGDEEEGKQVV